jgi:hypothetical protein
MLCDAGTVSRNAMREGRTAVREHSHPERRVTNKGKSRHHTLEEDGECDVLPNL